MYIRVSAQTRTSAHNNTDDNIPERAFDNFQFVNFTDVMGQTVGRSAAEREAQFALRVLMEIPEQYKVG